MNLTKKKIVTRAILATILSSIMFVSTSADFKWLSHAEREAVSILIQKYNKQEILTIEDKMLLETLHNSFDTQKEHLTFNK